jgi:hypothetical protein
MAPMRAAAVAVPFMVSIALPVAAPPAALTPQDPAHLW